MPEWHARQRGKIERALEEMSALLGGREWCHGNAFSLADIAVGCALGCLDFRIADLNWRDRHPLLVAHAAKLALRPSFAATVPRLVEGISIDFTPDKGG
jgi:glutathione S-transferase